MKERKTLEEMANESSSISDGAIVCPRCRCKDFRTYATIPGFRVTFRRKRCRNCGLKIFTSSRTEEKIIRKIGSDEDSEDQIFSLIG